MSLTIRDVQQVVGAAQAASTSQQCPVFATNPETGDCIVVFTFTYYPTGWVGTLVHAAPTDTAGNVYLPLSSQLYLSGSGLRISMWIAQHAVGGSNFKVTVNTVPLTSPPATSRYAFFLSGKAWAITNPGGAGLNYNGDAASSTGTGTTATATTAAATYPALVIGGVISDIAVNPYIVAGADCNALANGFTTTMRTAAQIVAGQAFNTEYRLDTSGPSSITWTQGSSQAWAALVASVAAVPPGRGISAGGTVGTPPIGPTGMQTLGGPTTGPTGLLTLAEPGRGAVVQPQASLLVTASIIQPTDAGAPTIIRINLKSASVIDSVVQELPKALGRYGIH